MPEKFSRSNNDKYKDLGPKTIVSEDGNLINHGDVALSEYDDRKPYAGLADPEGKEPQDELGEKDPLTKVDEEAPDSVDEYFAGLSPEEQAKEKATLDALLVGLFDLAGSSFKGDSVQAAKELGINPAAAGELVRTMADLGQKIDTANKALEDFEADGLTGTRRGSGVREMAQTEIDAALGAYEPLIEHAKRLVEIYETARNDEEGVNPESTKAEVGTEEEEASSGALEDEREAEVRKATTDAQELAASAAATPAEEESSGKLGETTVERTEGGGTHIRGPFTITRPTIIERGNVSSGSTMREAREKALQARTAGNKNNNTSNPLASNESGKRTGWLERRRQKKAARRANNRS